MALFYCAMAGMRTSTAVDLQLLWSRTGITRPSSVPALMQNCRKLASFFRSSRCVTMRPHASIKVSTSQWMADICNSGLPACVLKETVYVSYGRFHRSIGFVARSCAILAQNILPRLSNLCVRKLKLLNKRLPCLFSREFRGRYR
jgi:hypothetical protein